MNAQAKCDFNITGTLLEHAEARHLPLAGGNTVPVLCFVLQSESSIGTVCRVHQHFPLGQELQCEARARELRRDMRVTIQAPSVGIELVVHNASQVQVEQEAVQAAEAVPA